MSRGKKLDLEIGANFTDGWQSVEESVEKATIELLSPNEHSLVFQREKRKGKVITLVGRFALSESDAVNLLKRLKKSLATGGTYKAPWMEFQGEVKEKVNELLIKEGFKFKR